MNVRPGREHIGWPVTEDAAFQLFQRGRHLRVAQTFVLGYRPGYVRRLRRGKRSWYFRFEVNGEELIAVVGQGVMPGEFVWLTTYGRTPQSDQYRSATYDQIVAAA